MSDKWTYRLVREVREDGYRHAIFSVTAPEGSMYAKGPRLEVYHEADDVTGRPYWEEENDKAVEAGVLELALLHPESMGGAMTEPSAPVLLRICARCGDQRPAEADARRLFQFTSDGLVWLGDPK